MIPHLLYYQLTVLGLLWFFIMLYYLWPSPGGTAPTQSSKPITARHKRSNEPAAVGRRVTTLCKSEDGLRQHLAAYHAYLQFLLAPCCLTRASGPT